MLKPTFRRKAGQPAKTQTDQTEKPAQFGLGMQKINLRPKLRLTPKMSG